ncbi:MAG TPA: nucleotidyltransferase domain-containing protein [Acidobacteriota bacterium]|jgi:hypothetical protein
MSRLYETDQDIRSRILPQIAACLADEPKVAFAYVFGSFVTAETFHDIDVGIYLWQARLEGATFEALRLADLLSRRLKLPVDIRILNFAPTAFLFHVLRGLILLNRDEDLHDDVVERTICRYLDMAALLRRSTREAFAA